MLVEEAVGKGQEVCLEMLKGNYEGIIEARKLVSVEMIDYQLDKWKKWPVLVIGLVLSVLFNVYVTSVLLSFNVAKYDRIGLEKLVQKHFKEYTFNDILQDDLLIPSFDLTSSQPRFYSKHFKSLNPGLYDIPLAQAILSSSSVPHYFDPSRQVNEFN